MSRPGVRRISAEGVELIKRWEGLRLEAYLCPAGVWTIGYGHTQLAHEGQVITEDEAEALLRTDLEAYEDAVSELITVELTDNQFAALVSFAFNVGAGALARSTLRRRLNAGRYEDVPEQLMRWTRGGGRVLQGLVNRRAAEAGLWAREAFVHGRDVEIDDVEDAA